MKILKREKIKPIHMAPGDSIRLSYREPFQEERVVCTHVVDRSVTFDEAMVFELERVELAGLDLEDAIGGLFGKTVGDGTDR